MTYNLKLSFNSLDIVAIVNELQPLIGYRIDQIYDVDDKTYLLKLHNGNEKCVLLMESGVRFHMTNFDWHKNTFPSNFTMKLRKHLRNRRIERIQRVGKDRIVDFEIGSGVMVNHLIVELFNRGNIILTDSELLILRVLRPHTENDKFKFMVNQAYPVSRALQHEEIPDLEAIFNSAKTGDKILKILLPHVDFGPSLLEHLLLTFNYAKDTKYTGEIPHEELGKFKEMISEGKRLVKLITFSVNPGYIIEKVEKIEGKEIKTYQDVQPYMFQQYKDYEFLKFPNFNEAVDEYFSKLENNKNQLQQLQKQKEVLEKVEKVKADQEKRVEALATKQSECVYKAELILAHADLLDQIINGIRTAIASQVQWSAIRSCISDIHNKSKDRSGLTIDNLKLEINTITVSLNDPHHNIGANSPKKVSVDLDLALSAHANATKYYKDSKNAAKKEQKTIEAQKKVIKTVEEKAKSLLKEVDKTRTVTVNRKPLWFEKFYWFISSDKYLVIGGRDQQQNELIVKRYMKQGDIYVHADLHGASNVIIKNPNGNPVPPRTLEEAGCIAVCYSVGWEAKVMCGAWWVNSDQVSKTPPSGEYLTTGSFVIRGTKNQLYPPQLCLGFGFMFRLDDDSARRRIDEEKEKWTNASLEEEINAFNELKPEEFEDLPSAFDDVKLFTNLFCQTDPTKAPENSTESSLKSERNSSEEDNLDSAIDLRNALKNNENTSLHQEQNPSVQEKEGPVFSIKEVEELKPDDKTFDSVNVNNGIEVNGETENIKMTEEPKHERSRRLSKKERKALKKSKKAKLEKDLKGNYESTTSVCSEDAELKRKAQKSTAEVQKEKPKENTCELLNKTVNNQEKIGPKQEGNSELKDETSSGKGSKQEPPVKLKRGQKSKQKQIKEKYKDQDEEERMLRMAILKPDGEKKLTKKEQKNLKKQKKGNKVDGKQGNKNAAIKSNFTAKEAAVGEKVENKTREVEDMQKVENKVKDVEDKPKVEKALPKEQEDEDEDELKDEENLSTVDLIFKLTGQPIAEDELMFAIPIVAPYCALNDFKYKLKLMPGSLTRGKAAKMALNHFVNSKQCVGQEKLLIKKITIDAMCRNFPGKVKLHSLKTSKKSKC